MINATIFLKYYNSKFLALNNVVSKYIKQNDDTIKRKMDKFIIIGRFLTDVS